MIIAAVRTAGWDAMVPTSPGAGRRILWLRVWVGPAPLPPEHDSQSQVTVAGTAVYGAVIFRQLLGAGQL